ncbi:MAG: hypothetical protein KIT20_11865 [Alphaproteobacteria bacterium]|nr:hypothetical protein [Alphaproteobacteria bacterium]
MAFARILFAGLLAATLLACGEPTKEDILKKADKVATKSALEKALGKPDDIAKLGPVEKWTYKASNGQVVFLITGDSVAFEATTDRKN